MKAINPRVIELLVKWHELHEQGQSVTAEALCSAEPELLPELRRRLQQLQGFEALADESTPEDADRLTAAEAALPQLEGYEILERLGHGGMGVVYKARQTSLSRVVALKMILAGGQAGEEERARFRREAEAVARLQHPNIVQIYEVGEEGGHPYFSLEFVDGGTLSQKLSEGPQPSNWAARLVETLAQAVQAAHERGVVHRDLKPGNVLLTADGHPKITDFGLAKQLDVDSRQTRSGDILGTPCYMAPEQAAGDPRAVGTAADVYALGGILYAALTGRPPFSGATYLETLAQVRRQEPVPPRRLRADVPRDLEAICLKCLEKDPRQRYGSAGQLAEDLNRFANGRPVRARPLRTAARLGRWCRRNPALAAVAGLVVSALLTVLVLAICLTLYRSEMAADLEARARQARTAEEQAREHLRQRDQAEEHRRRLARQGAQIALDKALTLCEQGRVGPGLLWLARGLELAPADAAELQCDLRAQLGAWSAGLVPQARRLEHEAPVHLVAFGPDGRTVLTGSEDRAVRLWDVATGRLRCPPLVHSHPVNVLAFSPDGKALLTGCGDPFGSEGEARLWDAATGKLLCPPLRHQHAVVVAAFSPDGKLLLTGTHRNILPNRKAKAQFWGQGHLWHVATGKPLGQPLPHEDGVAAATFSPDGRTILTGSWDRTARLWDTTGKPLSPPLRHRDGVTVLAFSPDGKTALTGSGGLQSDKGEVRLWRVPSGKRLGKAFEQGETILAATFSPTGPTILTSGRQGARLWDVTAREPLGPSLQAEGHVWRAAVGSDGRVALLLGATVQVWDPATGSPLGPPLPHGNTVSAAAFSPDGKTLLTGCHDRSAYLWSSLPTQPVVRYLPSEDLVFSSPDSKTLLTIGLEGVRCWETARGRPLKLPIDFLNLLITRTTLSPNGKFVLLGERAVALDGADTARVWDTDTGKAVGPPLEVGDVEIFALSPDGKTVWTGKDEQVRRWDTATGKPLGKPLEHRDPLAKIAFSPDGRSVLTASQDQTVRRWDSATAKPIGEPFAHRATVCELAFSADGWTLLTRTDPFAIEGAEARVWDLRTGKPLGAPFRSAEGRLAAALSPPDVAALSPDGKIVATGSEDGRVRLWSVATREALTPPLQLDGPVLALAFSPDGKTIVTGSGGQKAERKAFDLNVKVTKWGKARLWEVATTRPLGPPLLQPSAVQGVSFLRDGRTILVSVPEDNRHLLWTPCAPAAGSPERIALWVQVQTGLELHDQGRVRELDTAAWQERRWRLAVEGRSPR